MATYRTPFVSYRNQALTNTPIRIRPGPTEIWGWIINNPNANEVFIQCFNAAEVTDITLGTTVCDVAIKVPLSGSVVEDPDAFPVDFFDKGLVVAATTTETGSTDPGSAISVVIKYN